MNKLEALGLECICEQMFTNDFDHPELSMNLTGRLKLSWNGNYVVFDVNTGEATYINYMGDMDDLLSACDAIKKSCREPGQQRQVACVVMVVRQPDWVT